MHKSVMSGMVVRLGIGLAMERSQILPPAIHYSVMTLGKVYTWMCHCAFLCKIWYWPEGSYALWLGR